MQHQFLTLCLSSLRGGVGRTEGWRSEKVNLLCILIGVIGSMGVWGVGRHFYWFSSSGQMQNSARLSKNSAAMALPQGFPKYFLLLSTESEKYISHQVGLQGWELQVLSAY